MRGRVLGYDTASGEGVISGDDGNRYPMTRGSLGLGVSRLHPGNIVDFVVESGRATNIFPLPEGGAAPKNKWIAALLALFLGGFGIHKFYLGRNTAGVIMLLASLIGILFAYVPTAIMGFVAFVEGVIYIIRSEQDFHNTYVAGDRAWF
jgi:TM2 domain-containing membrane protein YozV/cold shock CspA family protein